MGRVCRVALLVAALVCVPWALGGCAAASAQGAVTADDAAQLDAESEPEDPNRLPRSLEAVDPTDEQRAQIRALGAKLKPRLEPMREAGGELALAIAESALRCNADGLAMQDASSWAVRVGQQMRDPILDSIDALHAILTKVQRKALAERLMNAELQSKSKGKRNTDKGARSLGDVLDLSFGQMLSVLARAQVLRGALERRLEPWRDKLKLALAAFPDENFAIRDHAIARVPAVALVTRFVRDAVRTLLPVLDPEQCTALGEFIKEKVTKKPDEPAEPPESPAPQAP